MGGFAGANHFAASGAIGPKVQSNPAQGFAAQNGYVNLLGWSARETGGTNPVTVTIRDGGVVGGNIVAEFEIDAGKSCFPAHFGPEGIKVPVQCYVQVAGTGVVSGVLYIR